jgi:hypothetical protein
VSEGDTAALEAHAAEYYNYTGTTIEAPDWSSAGMVHDWRHYIPPEVRSIWERLSYEARLSIYVVAARAADSEQWD